MKLNGVMINSQDSKALAEFYTKVFGEAGWQDNGFFGYAVDGGYLMVAPHSEVTGKNNDAARVMIMLVSDDVKSEFEKMKSQGAGVVAEPYQPDPTNMAGTWLATLSDPDGNYLQLATPWEA